MGMSMYRMTVASLAVFLLCFSSPAFSEKTNVFIMKVEKTKLGDSTAGTWSTGYHGLAAKGNSVYAAFVGNPTEAIFFCRSDDGGLTWMNSVKIADYSSSSPNGVSIAVGPNAETSDPGDVIIHVVWDGEDSDRGNGRYARSTDGGHSWSEPVAVNDGTGISADWGVSVAADQITGKAYVAWHSAHPDRNVYVSSSDDGASWSTTQINTTGSRGVAPSIGVSLTDGSDPFVAWSGQDGNVYFSKNASGGWSSPVMVNGAYRGGYPSLTAYSSSKVYVCWQGVVCASSSNGGNSWTQSVVANAQGEPSVAVSPNGDVNVAWGSIGVYFSRSKNGGQSWSPPARVSSSGGLPNLAVDYKNDALIMWGNDGFNSPIFFSREK